MVGNEIFQGLDEKYEGLLISLKNEIDKLTTGLSKNETQLTKENAELLRKNRELSIKNEELSAKLRAHESNIRTEKEIESEIENLDDAKFTSEVKKLLPDERVSYKAKNLELTNKIYQSHARLNRVRGYFKKLFGSIDTSLLSLYYSMLGENRLEGFAKKMLLVREFYYRVYHDMFMFLQKIAVSLGGERILLSYFNEEVDKSIYRLVKDYEELDEKLDKPEVSLIKTPIYEEFKPQYKLFPGDEYKSNQFSKEKNIWLKTLLNENKNNRYFDANVEEYIKIGFNMRKNNIPDDKNIEIIRDLFTKDMEIIRNDIDEDSISRDVISDFDYLFMRELKAEKQFITSSIRQISVSETAKTNHVKSLISNFMYMIKYMPCLHALSSYYKTTLHVCRHGIYFIMYIKLLISDFT